MEIKLRPIGGSVKRVLGILLAAMVLCVGCGEKEQNGYIFHVQNESGEGIEGVTLQICTDALCKQAQTDSSGTVVFAGEDGVYQVHVLKCPAEYSCDPDATYRTKDKPEEVVFVLQSAAK